MTRQYSIVEYYGEQEGHTCGYCKNSDTNFSHGMWAHSMTVQDYQNLIDRGWRRSGCYCYKPAMDKICCPMYTIKCEALHFKISKSQKKILKRMAKFLRNELKKDDHMDTNDTDQRDNIDINMEEIPNFNKHLQRAQQNASEMNVISVDDELNEKLCFGEPKERNSCDSKDQQKGSKTNKPVPNESTNSHVSLRADQSLEKDSRTPCKKAKLLRIERKQKKLLAQGKSQKEIDLMFSERKQQNSVKTIEELFDEMYSGTNKLEFASSGFRRNSDTDSLILILSIRAHRNPDEANCNVGETSDSLQSGSQVKLVRTSPMSSGYLKTSKKSYEIYRKYQTTIHGVPAEKITEKRYTRFLVKSPLQIKLVRVMSEEFIDTLDASANLYKKYQMAIHGDSPEECDKKSFFNFLVKSPLQQWVPDNGPPKGYGSFHEQYWLDNELIAVGVIDILPSCVSSVYFFYDPAYSHLSLGTFSSLREVYLTRQLNKYAEDLKYYYMGFYIHTCPKMRYKARMKPSRLLCPETYKWFDIESCLKKLDKEKYSRLNNDIDDTDDDGFIDIRKILVLYRQAPMSYKVYKERSQRSLAREEERELKEYSSLVGMKCAQSLLLYRC